MLDKAIRDLDRERAGLQTQEKKLIVEIKKMAKANQMVRSSFMASKPLGQRPCAPDEDRALPEHSAPQHALRHACVIWCSRPKQE